MLNKKTKINLIKVSVARNEVHFSVWQLLLVAAGFGLVGVLLLLRSSAAQIEVASFQGEAMSQPAGSFILSDSSASGSKALGLNNNGTTTYSLSTANAANQVTVRLKGSSCEGAPQAIVRINSVQVLSVSAGSTSWSDYSSSVNVPAGSHTLSVTFSNDHTTYKGKSGAIKCSRALFIDKVTLFGIQSVSEPAPAPAPEPTPTPEPSPEPTVSCTKTLAAGGAVQAFIDSLSAGQTGCLRGGTYTLSSTLYFRKAGTTITSYPGERATINGYSEVSRGADNIKITKLNFSSTTSPSTIRIYGNNTLIEATDFTNNHVFARGSCIGIGGSEDVPSGVIIRQNKIHNCGSNQDQLNHGIYALAFRDLTITENIIWMSGGYSIQLYPNGTRAKVTHNVIDGSKEYSLRGGIVIDGTTAVEHLIEYNIIANTKTAGIVSRTGYGHIARNNCFWSNDGGNISGSNISVSGNIDANPLFVNKAARDYRLSSGSGCLPVVQYDTAAKVAAQ